MRRLLVLVAVLALAGCRGALCLICLEPFMPSTVGPADAGLAPGPQVLLDDGVYRWRTEQAPPVYVDFMPVWPADAGGAP